MPALQELEEVQLLQAMYMDDLLLDDRDTQTLGKIELDLKPNVADNDDACFIQCRIIIKLDKEYPNSLPKISFDKVKGLEDNAVSGISRQLQHKAQELLSSGNPMLFELIELARELLTTNNVPKTECMVCLIPFGEDEEDDPNEFMKSHCFHYFHRMCLAQWVFHNDAAIAKKREEIKELSRAFPEKAASMSEGLGHNCPHCRELLLPEDFKLIESHLDSMKQAKQRELEEEAQREIQRQKEAASQAFRESLMPPPIELNLEEEEIPPVVREVQETSKEEEVPQLNHPTINNPKISSNQFCVKVSGISKNRNITKDLLKQVFTPLGSKKCRIMYAKGRPLGYAIIEFDTLQSAQSAINSVNNSIQGHPVTCTIVDNSNLVNKPKKS